MHPLLLGDCRDGSVIDRVRGGDTVDVETWTERLLTAATVSEFFD